MGHPRCAPRQAAADSAGIRAAALDCIEGSYNVFGGTASVRVDADD